MPNTCAQAMDKLGMYAGTICVRLTTVLPQSTLNQVRLFINRLLVPCLAHHVPTTSSTGKIAFLPLVEQMFYPFSTEPITKRTKED